MTDEPLNPIERLRVHLTLEHHEEDADAFALVDSLIQSYALEYPDDLTTDAQEFQTLLLDVIESWTPTRVCAGCGNEDAIDNGLCQACVDHQYASNEALRAALSEARRLLATRVEASRLDEANTRIADLEHALKVCHADANRALLSGIRGDYQDALLTIRLTAGNAIA